MKRVLMIAYHFPPLAGSSGIQRTLRFVQHLPRYGWQPIVVTATTHSYDRVNADLWRDIPADTVVRRALALDTARHLAIGGRYLGFMARPDRWVSWRFDAMRQAMKAIGEFEPQVIWSTYPVATAHLIGAELHRRSGLPWVADFRDPMAQEGYPADPVTHRQFLEIEKAATDQAAWCVFTTPGAARTYRERYPSAAERITVVENGYDEESFASVQAGRTPNQQRGEGPTMLLHSGIVYPKERNPVPLFTALGRLVRSGRIDAARLRLRFRAAVHDEMLRELAREHAIEPLIEICPPLDYLHALDEMLDADALLAMQGHGCNDQIPAKLYEYLRARRPILGLTDPRGDTAALMRRAGLDAIARMDSAEEIEALLPRFVDDVRAARANYPDAAAVARASRASRAEALAQIFDALPQAAPARNLVRA
jgi:hypothetical protein